MNKVIKINYITTPSWWDTDITLIPQLSKNNFEINLIILVPHENSKFSENEIKQFCDLNKINLSFIKRNHKIRSISNVKIAISVFKILRSNKLSGAKWIFYEYITDPYLNILLFFFERNKTIISFHNYREHSHQKGNTIDRLFKYVYLKWFNLFHLHSKEQYELFRKMVPKKRSIYTVMPPKDFGFPLRNLNFKKNGKTNFLFFGFIKEYKNLSLLINAFEELNYSDTILTIAGNCNDFSAYEKLIVNKEKYNLNIRFIENNEIPIFFMNADFLILPYKDTTQSGPLLIAMNYNLPIIASNIAPFNKLIEDKVDGLLFDVKDYKSLIKTLSYASDLDKKDYQLIKQNQKNRVARYLSSCEQNGLNLYNFLTINGDR